MFSTKRLDCALFDRTKLVDQSYFYYSLDNSVNHLECLYLEPKSVSPPSLFTLSMGIKHKAADTRAIFWKIVGSRAAKIACVATLALD